MGPPDTDDRAPPNPSQKGWYSINVPRRDWRLSEWLLQLMMTSCDDAVGSVSWLAMNLKISSRRRCINTSTLATCYTCDSLITYVRHVTFCRRPYRCYLPVSRQLGTWTGYPVTFFTIRSRLRSRPKRWQIPNTEAGYLCRQNNARLLQFNGTQ